VQEKLVISVNLSVKKHNGVLRWIFEIAEIYGQIAGNRGKIAGSYGKFEEKIAGALIKLAGISWNYRRSGNPEI
jgi:hypothetical protein